MRNNGGLILSDSGSGNYSERPLSRLLKFYIGNIGEADEYVEEFEAIRSAGADDIVVLHINSFGGDLFTAIQFMRVIAETKATVVASCEGACMSAATMIFLSAGQYEISEHVSFMFHNYSKMSAGKGGELFANITFERKWSESIMRKVYKHFLTEEEITQLLDDKDIWMDGPEVVTRLTKRSEKFKAEQQAAEEAALAPPKKPTKAKTKAK
jgi:ATP-dependent protease ClpP protease subunit